MADEDPTPLRLAPEPLAPVDVAAPQRVRAAALFLLMVVVALLCCVASPLAWLWLGSQFEHASHPTPAVAALVFAGFAATTVVLGRALAALNRRLGGAVGRRGRRRVHLPWLKSMRGERHDMRERTVLDTIMHIAAVLALIGLTVWFLVFAGPPPSP
jgi:hypothetical protein